MITDHRDVAARLNALSEEKLQLGAIRSLLEDDRFVRYLSGLKRRYKKTIPQLDAVDPKDSIIVAKIQASRKTYAYEIAIIEGASDRIKSIDAELTLLNKERKTKLKGNEGTSGIVPPRGK